MSESFPLYKPLGDSALTVVIGEGISRELSQRVTNIAHALDAKSIDGVNDIVPSYASIGVYYDATVGGFDEMVERIRQTVAAPIENEGRNEPRTIRIPVRYDGEDLSDVANRTGHTEAEVIRLHSMKEYFVYVIGFVPGWAYLGDIDDSLVLPRRSAPRKKVVPGSVAIAETQTGVYPFATPGGWHLIGRTETKMFDPLRDPPALLRVGDRVVFEQIK